MNKKYLISLLCLGTILAILVTCQELEKSILVSTGEITRIQTNSAEASGTIVDMGEGITQHGHYYSKSSDPAKDILKTSLGNPEGTGGFISQVTGLEAGTKYYIVAYATGSKGSSFGDIKSFTTLPAQVPVLGTSDITAVTTTSATSGGDISDGGGATVTARGVCWGTTTGPTVDGNKTTDGSGIGSFSSSITGLVPGTAYYARAYATNSAGTGYGDEKSFRTIAAALPVLTANSVTDITKITAVTGGNITSDGGMPVTARGVCWNVVGVPTTADSKTSDGTGNGSFVSNIAGLTQGTKYYVRAYAVNYAGTAYSTEISFTTVADVFTVPTISTLDVTEITQTTANSGGNITADGGTAVTERGICWNTAGSPTTSDNKKTEGSGSGTFVSTLTGLIAGTTYHVRAYAVNIAGISYGAEVSFTTNVIPAPVATTSDATSLTISGATLNGIVNANGNSTSVTFEYGTTNTYGSSINASQSPVTSSSGINVSAVVSGLSAGTTYHFRVKAVSTGGTVYGDDRTFSIDCSLPAASTEPATTIATTTATLNGKIDANDFSTSASFEYGLTAAYGSIADAAPSPVTGSSNIDVSSSLTGLIPNSTYHFRVKAVNCAGTLYGSARTFTTVCGAPVISGMNVTDHTSSSATLNGIVNPSNASTTVIFEYGISTSYGSNVTADQSPLTGNTNNNVSASISSLNANTTYHYRIKTTNCAGTTYSVDNTFNTMCLLPVAATSPATLLTTTTATLNGAALANGCNTNVSFEYWIVETAKTSVSATPSSVAGTSSTNISASLIGLSPSTTYYYRVKAVSSSGTVYSSVPYPSFNTMCPVPTATTNISTNILNTSATLNGTVNANGSICSTVVTFEYGLTNSYGSEATAAQSPVNGSSSMNVSVNITGLGSGNTYHYRVKAVSASGTSYGEDKNFTTTIKDPDGNTYTSVTIGTQVWMKENLKTTKYNDNAAIPHVTDNTWYSIITPAYCWYNNDPGTYKDTYGALYNYWAANNVKLCPSGWHVPSLAEWNTLETFLGGNTIAGGKLKEAGSIHWYNNAASTNESGFTALPGGFRDTSPGSEGFKSIHEQTFIRSSTNYAMCLVSNYVYSNITSFGQREGATVRCIKD